MAKSNKNEIEKLRQWYKEELMQKDKEIQKLKDNNIIVLKAALKQSKKLEEFKKRFEKALKK